MANRLEWQQISAQGLNPQSAMGLSIEGFRGAAKVAQDLRNSERANEEAILGGYNDLIRNSLLQDKINASLESEKETTAPYDYALGENLFFDHFEQGGTLDNISQNSILSGFIQQYGEDAWKHATAAKTRWDKEVQTEFTRLSSALDLEYNYKKDEIDRRSDPDDVKQGLLKDLDAEFHNRRMGLQELAIKNLSSRRSFGRFALGNIPGTNTDSAQRGSTDTVATPGSTGGSSSAPRKSDVFKEFSNDLHTEYQIQRESLQQDLDYGVITREDFEKQLEALDNQFNKSLANLDAQQKRFGLVDVKGEHFRFNYMIDNSGVVWVDGKKLSPEVSKALTEASEAFGVPMDTVLAVTRAESAFNSNAVSPSNVAGLMQVTTKTTEDMMKQYKGVFEERNLTDSSDRSNPRVSALSGVAYLAHIRDKYLGGSAPIDQLYVAYNLGPNNPLVNKFHIRNVPIDKLPGVNVGLDSFQKNKGLYYNNKENRWKTVEEISSEIKSRMGLEPERGNSDVIRQLSQAANISENDAARWVNENSPNLGRSNELPIDEAITARELGTRSELNLFENPDAGLNYAADIYTSVLAAPIVQATGSVGGGAGGASKLSATKLKEMLKVTGIETSPQNLSKVYEAINKNPDARNLPAEDLAVVLSYAPVEMWSWNDSMDVAAFEKNLENLMTVWETHKSEIRKQMTRANNLKRYTEGFQEIYTKTKNEIQALDNALYDYQGKDPRSMSATDIKAMEIATEQKAKKENYLHKMTIKHQQDMQKEINAILGIRKAIKDAFTNASSQRAENDVKNNQKGKGETSANTGGTSADLRASSKSSNDLIHWFENRF
ncbi:peptidoglycan hydrolase [Pseudomonas phage ZC08]|uniref:Peptidoglycan hydrolase n=1 Tax=Pseudomonas phage ZC08 TaxID=1622116 RepID=A0A1L2C9F5_9CAUD|nr:peptidoglycan hydrolase [Pseudomonas phage ZC08]AMD43540.1 peptidoglycan hydrolase [Pseudomonas phage ZC08]